MAVRAEVRWLLCLAHRLRNRVNLQSKNQKPLERYFPEVARGIEQIAEDGFVLDGELVIVGGSFEALQLRLHPAESRIRRLARETPAQLIVFDLLAPSEDRTGRDRALAHQVPPAGRAPPRC